MTGSVPADVVAFLGEWFNDSPYLVGHTSGSTGVPKEIRLLKSDMRASARLTNGVLGIDATSTLLLCLSPSYIAGKMMIVRALEAGASLIVVEPSSTPLNGVQETVTMAAMVPMQVLATLRQKDGEQQLLAIKQLLVGGAPLDRATEHRLAQLPIKTYVTYGMTETVSHVALRRVGINDGCYEAIGDVTFATDNRGCLVIDAPQLSDRKFVTNDVVSLRDARHFVWQGRYDNVIMSGGLKYCAEVLEKKIAEVMHDRYYFTSSPDERLGERIVLVIESAPYEKEKEAQMLASLTTLLSRYEIPREVRYCERFAVTSSGKVKRG